MEALVLLPFEFFFLSLPPPPLADERTGSCRRCPLLVFPFPPLFNENSVNPDFSLFPSDCLPPSCSSFTVFPPPPEGPRGHKSIRAGAMSPPRNSLSISGSSDDFLFLLLPGFVLVPPFSVRRVRYCSNNSRMGPLVCLFFSFAGGPFSLDPTMFFFFAVPSLPFSRAVSNPVSPSFSSRNGYFHYPVFSIRLSWNVPP